MITWKEIAKAGQQIVDAHKEMVSKSKALAELLQYNDDYILRRVLHEKPAERGNSDKIMFWLEVNKDTIVDNLKRFESEKNTEREKAKLLATLKLNDEQMKLLGIKP